MKKFVNRRHSNAICIALGITTLAVGASAQAQQDSTGNSATLYGFVRLDAIFDNKAQSADDWASFLMTQPASTANHDKGFYATARTSRLGVKGAMADGQVKYQLEGDMNGNTNEGGVRPGTLATNSTGFRLRQANISTGNWLFGQTWSTAFDGASMPESVEFNPPLTAVALRQAQVRYTADFGAGNSLAVALENPSSNIYVTDGISSNKNKRPDLVTRFSHQADWGHLSLMGVSHEYALDTGKSAIGSLLALGASANLGAGGSRLVAGLTSGNGAGRYQWASILQGAYQRTDGSINTFKSTGYHVGLALPWGAPGVRSNFNYAATTFNDVANGQFVSGLHNKKLSQIQLNTFFPLAKGVEGGIELETGTRKQMDISQADGKESRINFMVTASF